MFFGIFCLQFHSLFEAPGNANKIFTSCIINQITVSHQLTKNLVQKCDMAFHLGSTQSFIFSKIIFMIRERVSVVPPLHTNYFSVTCIQYVRSCRNLVTVEIVRIF